MLTNRQEIAFFSFLGFILLTFVVLIYLIGNRVSNLENSFKTPNVPLPIGNIEIEAKSALVYDIISGKTLFAKNPDTRLPLASLTKVMTALVARDIASKENEIIITAEAIKEDGDAGLVVGERWRLGDLLDFSLVTSANDGMKAVSLLSKDFVSLMNTRSSQIGMKNTYYMNDTGLDLPAQAGESQGRGGAYGSARDQALLLEHVIRNYPDLLGATKVPVLTIRSLDGLIHIARNTNLIVGEIPGLIASKTGFTKLAGGNLLIAFDPEVGRPIIISILGSSEDGRFEDMKKLVQASLASVENSVISNE